MIDIIVPMYNQAELTIKCLSSIRETNSRGYRLLWIDNGSTDEDHMKVLKEVMQHQEWVLHRNFENQGFVKAINWGLESFFESPESEYVVLLNNDTEVSPHWLEKLQEPFSLPNVKVGAVGPVTTSPECWQGREKVQEGIRILPKSAMLAFFCVMLSREAISECGFLDESFEMGLGDDDDYCRRLHRLGYELALVQDLVIKHAHRSTFKSLYTKREVEKMTQRGLAIYRKKWGIQE